MKYDNEKLIIFSEKLYMECKLNENFPDYIVGLFPDGVLPSMYVAKYLSVPCFILNKTDGYDSYESNLWMAEDAFGYLERKRHNIWVIEENMKDKTIEWIKRDWMSGCFPHDSLWDEIWNNNVKFKSFESFESDGQG